MRVWAVVGLVLLAGCAWAFAETPAAGRGAAQRFVLGTGEVVEALRTAGIDVDGSQVRLPGELSAAVEHPELRVSGAERRNEVVVVRMRCAAAAECLPFFAEVRPGSAEQATVVEEQMRAAGRGGAMRAGVTEAGGVARAADGGRMELERGVVVGARIRLELRDRQMRIVLPAVAVDAGAPGTEVRVASLDRKHTYRGVVVDAELVRGGVE